MKGPIPLATICELLDISPEEAKSALERELEGDCLDEALRQMYGRMAKELEKSQSELIEKITKQLDL